MAVHRGGGTFVDGIEGVDLLVTELRRVPDKAKRKVRKAIVDASSGIRADMAKRASWSSRIPAALRVRVRFSAATVELRVDKRAAPHARPYEGIGRAGSFRHPVYGHEDRWVSEQTRPFFFPAVDANKKAVRDAVERAVYAALPR